MESTDCNPLKTDAERTKELINKHPLKDSLKDVVLKAWEALLKSSLGGYKIGKKIFPEPQVIGNILHILIALYIQKDNPDYQAGSAKTEKDIHNIKDASLSIEIKTSSSPKKIFGNRSYGQKQSTDAKKDKDGYYLAINFDKIKPDTKPSIRLVRFGYLMHSDWIAQEASTGQQARLSPETYEKRFVVLYDVTKDVPK